ncbi:serine/threonine protein kinase [Polyangium spumosum]|uniref:Protein kinase n=1 Tax=Polyangium spumosum TaxID=889282 RepID=A0A6N7PKG5_9BACT|nr:serine/threonine protein kinase [Polyangium spumosum]MRG92632.1 protein kinase [Polyangium spumosum]
MAQPPPRPAASRPGGPAPANNRSAPASSSGPRPKEPEKQQPGTFFLGRYRVVDEIGVGGMASVHLARMDGPGGFQKWVAIKRIHPHLVEDDQFVDMFLDEARIAAGINHANVAQVFDLGKDDNTYWIAMEYLHGEPLREVMRRAEEKRMLISADLAARICADAAEGLHAAHELRGKNGQLLGLVHRDVTPHNLFVTYDGYTKVVDFGIAKVADRLASTRAGTLKGKLAYMSPEQVRGADVDRTTDIFALGVVLWELTTNQRLFRMDTDLDTLEKVQACNVPLPSTIVRGYPQGLEAVVMKALAKNKKDRYQTAREFSRALQVYLNQSGAFVGPEEVAQFVRHVFTDRIAKREAHLAWAAEVTSTVNVDQLRAQGGLSDDSLLEDEDDDRRGRASGTAPSKSAAQPIANRAPAAMPPPEDRSASQQMAATSLMDDDEDVPTTVATREHMERSSGAPLPSAGRPGAMPGPRPQLTTPMPAAGMPGPGQNERTAALPNGGYPGDADDLNATVALPANAKILDPGPPRPGFGAPPQPGFGGGYPAPPQAAFNGGPQPGFGFGQQPQQHPQMYGQQQPAYPSAISNPNPQVPQQYGQRVAQSQIETAMSLPRPDPAALWMAQQEAARQQGGPKRNTGVFVLVVALVALSVIGIGVLVYFKLKQQPPQEATQPTATAVPETPPIPTTVAVPAPAPAPAPAPTETAAAAPTEIAAPTPAPGPAPGTAPAAAKTNTTAPAPTATATAAAASGEPGFLTIVCNPFCDDVLDNGRSLGPSPIVHTSVKPGSHRITLKKGDMKKVISVIVVSGQVTAQRVSMK